MSWQRSTALMIALRYESYSRTSSASTESCVICWAEASSHLDAEYWRASPPTQSKCLGAGLEAFAKDEVQASVGARSEAAPLLHPEKQQRPADCSYPCMWHADVPAGTSARDCCNARRGALVRSDGGLSRAPRWTAPIVERVPIGSSCATDVAPTYRMQRVRPRGASVVRRGSSEPVASVFARDDGWRPVLTHRRGRRQSHRDRFRRCGEQGR